jgi:rubredoxin
MIRCQICGWVGDEEDCNWSVEIDASGSLFMRSMACPQCGELQSQFIFEEDIYASRKRVRRQS